jgi:hypothetical protein
MSIGFSRDRERTPAQWPRAPRVSLRPLRKSGWGDLFGEEAGSGAALQEPIGAARDQGQNGQAAFTKRTQSIPMEEGPAYTAAKTANGVNIEDGRQWPKRR